MTAAGFAHGWLRAGAPVDNVDVVVTSLYPLARRVGLTVTGPVDDLDPFAVVVAVELWLATTGWDSIHDAAKAGPDAVRALARIVARASGHPIVVTHPAGAPSTVTPSDALIAEVDAAIDWMARRQLPWSVVATVLRRAADDLDAGDPVTAEQLDSHMLTAARLVAVAELLRDVAAQVELN